MSSTSFLARLLSGVPPGQFVAIRHDRAEVIGQGLTSDEAKNAAAAAGDNDPIIVRIPNALDSLLAPRTSPSATIPFNLIARSIAGGGVVPFLGAGASQVGRPPGARFDESTAEFLPNTSELTELLGVEAKFPPRELPDSDLARVSSYLVLKGGPGALNYTLRRAIGPIEAKKQHRRCQPGSLHKFIAQTETIRLILTTNYDTLIEDALEDEGRAYDLLIYPSADEDSKGAVTRLRWPAGVIDIVDPQQLDLKGDRPVVFKMHGSFTHTPEGDSYIITEEDYLNFLKQMGEQGPIPKKVLALLRKKSLWFLGYGLKDWNLRLLLHNLGELRTSWAVQRQTTEAESALWAAKNIEIFETDIDEFVRQLKVELQRFPASAGPAVSQQAPPLPLASESGQ